MTANSRKPFIEELFNVNQRPSVKETLFGLFPTSSIANKTVKNIQLYHAVCDISYTPANSTIDQSLNKLNANYNVKNKD